jgi:uncharacterized protein YdeI (YjbR/CyaY-like superfamily)
VETGLGDEAVTRAVVQPKRELERIHPGTRRAWRQWLTKHHASSPGVWLVLDKAASGRQQLGYDAVVEEALCFGWIDGKAHTIDEATFRVLYKPRNPKSGWSAINKQRVERLIAEGLMAPAGLAKIEEAKKNGAWSSLDAVEALTMPDELKKALRANKSAAANYDAFAPSSKKVILTWIASAKRPETRAKRVAETVKLAAKGIKANHPMR